MIVCQHEDNVNTFMIIFEDTDVRLLKAFIERYGYLMVDREAGLAVTIGNGLYNPRFKAALRTLFEGLSITPLAEVDIQSTVDRICEILEVDEENLMQLLEGD